MGAARHFLKHPIDPAHMEVHMPVQAGAEPVDVDLGFCQCDCADVQGRLVHLRRCPHHAPGIARWAHAAAFAGIGHEVIVPAVITPRPGKAVREDAAFEVFAKSLTNIGLGVQSGTVRLG